MDTPRTRKGKRPIGFEPETSTSEGHPRIIDIKITEADFRLLSKMGEIMNILRKVVQKRALNINIPIDESRDPKSIQKNLLETYTIFRSAFPNNMYDLVLPSGTESRSGRACIMINVRRMSELHEKPLGMDPFRHETTHWLIHIPDFLRPFVHPQDISPKGILEVVLDNEFLYSFRAHAKYLRLLE